MNNLSCSILIPVYNSEKYVSEAIESALSQTYNNIEIIIVDDGSTDRSWEIIESYRERYPALIKTCVQENKGACRARNKAFELSSGNYIQYLDADDLLASNKIEQQIKLINERDDVVATCSFNKFKSDPVDSLIRKQLIDKKYENATDWLIDAWLGGGVGQTSIWLTPRNIVDQTGKWDETLKVNQDGDYFCRVLLNTNEIIYCPTTQIYYRDTPNSLHKNFNYNTCVSMIYSYENYVKYLSKRVDTPKIKIALAANFSSFYSYVYPNFPDLLKRAEDNIKDLGFNTFPIVGGNKFKKLGGMVGFKNAVSLRYKFSKLLK